MIGPHRRISSTDSKVRTFLHIKKKQYHRKVLLSRFYLNQHPVGFHLQTQKLEPTHPKSKQKMYILKNAARDNLFHYTIGFRLLTSKEG